jgi:hypothetical protein
MRKVALFAACLIAYAVLILFLVPARASALSPAGLPKGVFHHDGVQLVRRGFRGGDFRGHAFRGHAFRGGRAWRGGRHYGWRGRGWRGRGWRPGWGWGAAALTAPFVYGGYYDRCPLVRRTVWTPRGYRVRWVRRCW